MPSLTKPKLALCALAIGALAIPALACPAPLLAQTEPTEANNGSIFPDLESIEGKDTDTLGLVYLGIADCESDAEIVFNLPEVPDGKRSLDIYTGSACNETTRDNNGDNEGSANCNFIKNEEITVRRNAKVRLQTSDLVPDCSEGQTEEPKLWFIAVDTSQMSEDVGTNYGFILVNIDTSAPDAPTDVSGGSGENQIPVNWSVGDEEVDHFFIYVDSGSQGGDAGTPPQSDDDGGSSGATNAECGTGRLIAGSSGEDLPSSLRLSRVPGKTATDIDLRPTDIDGDAAAVAVVAVDRAGNQSPLSEVVCAFVVPTDGYKDLYEREAGHPIEQGCPCSALGPAQAQAAWPIVLALMAVARRGRRRRS